MANEISWSTEYIFDGLAGEKEKLEKAIVYCMRESGLTNKVKLVNIKGAVLFGSKNRCMRIQLDKTAYITVSCIDIGNFLYVSIFREEKHNPFAFARKSLTETDVFRTQQQNAAFSAINFCCKKAFAMLGIVAEC